MIKYTYLFIGCICLISSCQEPIEGCNDLEASNFDINADKLCADDCCMYPEIRFEFNHFIKQKTISGQDTILLFQNNIGYTFDDTPLDTILMHYCRFYISNIQLTNNEGQVSEINNVEHIESFESPSETIEYKDDIILANFNNNLYSIGSIPKIEDWIKLNFDFGLNPIFDTVDPSTSLINELSYLTNPPNYLSQVGYLNQYYSYQIGNSSSSDSIVVFTKINKNLEFDLPPLHSKKGFDTTFYFSIFYDQWFNNFDFNTGSSNQFSNQTVLNITNAIFLDSIRQQ